MPAPGVSLCESSKRIMMRVLRLVVALMLSVTLALSGCTKSESGAAATVNGGASTSASPPSAAGAGSPCPTSNTIAFAKTKFVLHAGLGVGSFHRYIYSPFRGGEFTSGGTIHKVATYGKAALAAAFTYHELKLVAQDIKASPALCKVLIAPLAKVTQGVSALTDKLKHRDSGGVETVNTDLTNLTSLAGQNGAAITDVTPSASQLASGG